MGSVDQTSCYQFYDLSIVRKRRRWKWEVTSGSGRLLMDGMQPSRENVRYYGYRALFLLLSVPVSALPVPRKK